MKNGKKLPSVVELRKRLSYDADSGVFKWISLPHMARKIGVGDVAGSFDGRYIDITLCGVRFGAHRAAIAMSTGVWPECVDHVDGNKTNNRLSNLRSATQSVNQQNQRRAHKSSSTGLLGVVPVPSRKSSKKFRAQIFINGRPKNLGYFMTAQEAHQTYLNAKRQLHPGCTI